VKEPRKQTNRGGGANLVPKSNTPEEPFLPTRKGKRAGMAAEKNVMSGKGPRERGRPSILRGD